MDTILKFNVILVSLFLPESWFAFWYFLDQLNLFELLNKTYKPIYWILANAFLIFHFTIIFQTKNSIKQYCLTILYNFLVCSQSFTPLKNNTWFLFYWIFLPACCTFTILNNYVDRLNHVWRVRQHRERYSHAYFEAYNSNVMLYCYSL